MLSCILNCASVTRVFLIFFHQQPETTFEQCLCDFRIPRTHDVDGNFLLQSLHVAWLFNDFGKFSMFKISLNCNGAFSQEKMKTTALVKNLFSLQTHLGTYINLYSFEGH